MKLWTVTMHIPFEPDVEPCTSVFSTEEKADDFSNKMKVLLPDEYEVTIDSQNLDSEEYYDWFLREGRV